MRSGDCIRVDLKQRRVDVLLTEEEIAARRADWQPPVIENHSPWQQFYRENVGQLETGACLEFAVKYHEVGKVIPRHSH